MNIVDILSKINDHVLEYKETILADLSSIIAQPSVSAKNQGIRECVDLLKEVLKREGFLVSILETKTGRPAVYAEKVGGERSILLYNHYDVQPPEPLDEWRTNPFELVEKNGLLYGRGVADNKGEIIARLAAVRVVEKVVGKLPVTIKWLIEGEEEVGSPSIEELLRQHGKLFKDAMGCLWEGGDVVEDVPHLYLGVKGMLYVEISLKTAESDAHSMYAPVIENSAEKLARYILTLKAPGDRINLPGFYKDVLKPTKRDRLLLSSARISPSMLAKSLGVKKLKVKKSEVIERLVFQPTCNIAGFSSGYTGPGPKTIVPSSASVKIDFRLVPNQNPEKILKSLKKRLAGVDVIVHSMVYPARISYDTPIVKIAVEAAEKVYGKRPVVLPNMFGTGPLYHFVRAGIPTAMLTALSHPGSKLHAPNENIYLDHLLKSVAHHAMIFIKAAGQAL